MNKRFILVLVAFVAVFGVLLTLGKRDNQTSNNESGSSNVAPTEHKTGEGTSGVTLIEYGDFECPACKQYFPLVEAVKQKYGDQITFQFRHFPLTQIHKNALSSARAAEAAAKQGKFWEMYAILYERQDIWKNSTNATSEFENYAQELSLDVEKFKEDLRSEEVNDLVQADLNEAQKLELSSTPSFVLNGEKIENPRSADDFYRVIDEAIAANQNQDQNQ